MLTDAQIKALAPRDKMYRVGDGRVLSLVVTPQDHKWWHFNYTIDGKSKKISMGWPDVPLESWRDSATGIWIQGARQRCEEARTLVAPSDRHGPVLQGGLVTVLDLVNPEPRRPE